MSNKNEPSADALDVYDDHDRPLSPDETKAAIGIAISYRAIVDAYPCDMPREVAMRKASEMIGRMMRDVVMDRARAQIAERDRLEREHAEREPEHPGWSHMHTGATYEQCAAATEPRKAN